MYEEEVAGILIHDADGDEIAGVIINQADGGDLAQAALDQVAGGVTNGTINISHG